MRLIVEEEYGFKYWLWDVEGTKEDVLSNFKKVTSVPTYDAERDKLGGSWQEVEWEEWRDIGAFGEYDGYAHIHNHDDSKLHWNEGKVELVDEKN